MTSPTTPRAAIHLRHYRHLIKLECEDDLIAIEAEARQQEREALAERIEALGPDHGQDDPCVCTPAGMRAAVLSILRGESAGASVDELALIAEADPAEAHQVVAEWTRP